MGLDFNFDPNLILNFEEEVESNNLVFQDPLTSKLAYDIFATKAEAIERLEIDMRNIATIDSRYVQRDVILWKKENLDVCEKLSDFTHKCKDLFNYALYFMKQRTFTYLKDDESIIRFKKQVRQINKDYMNENENKKYTYHEYLRKKRRAVKINNYLPWKKQNLLIAMTELKRISHNLNLPDYIKKDAFKTYKEALNANIVKGRSLIGMIAACVFYTCKIRKIPRTLQEIIKESNVTPKKIKSFYRVLVESLNLKTPVNNPVANIPRFITNLGLGFDVEKLTINILDAYLKNNSLQGMNPNGLCAGAIYLAVKFKNKRITQKRIADIVGVTDTTVRSRYNDIINKINLNILK